MRLFKKLRDFFSARFPYWMVHLFRFLTDVFFWIIEFAKQLISDAISGFRGS